MTPEFIRESIKDLSKNIQEKNGFIIPDDINKLIYKKYKDEPLCKNECDCYDFALPFGGMKKLTVYKYMISCLIIKSIQKYDKSASNGKIINNILNCNEIKFNNNILNEVNYLLDLYGLGTKYYLCNTNNNYLAIGKKHDNNSFEFGPIINNIIDYDNLVNELFYLNSRNIDNNTKYYGLNTSKQLQAVNNTLIVQYENFKKLLNVITNKNIDAENKMLLFTLMLNFYGQLEKSVSNCFPIGINDNPYFNDKFNKENKIPNKKELQDKLVAAYQQVQQDIQEKINFLNEYSIISKSTITPKKYQLLQKNANTAYA